MLETYTDFMIFELKDNGEKFRLNLTEKEFKKNNGKKILHPLKVAIIIKEELRRIFIWKGISSSVRRKFIASRVSSELQRKLSNSPNFHHCKIVSVDQGDEPEEFLSAFGFQKVPITAQKFKSNIGITSKKEILTNDSINKIENRQKNNQITNIVSSPPIKSPSYKKLKLNQQSRNLLKKILKNKIPENYERKNILVGNIKLYGLITKKAELFHELIEEKEWLLISNFPKDIIEIDGHKLRIYFNKESKSIEAIEVLESFQQPEKPIENSNGLYFNKWTVKALRKYCREKNIKIPSNSRKKDIIQLAIEYNS